MQGHKAQTATYIAWANSQNDPCSIQACMADLYHLGEGVFQGLFSKISDSFMNPNWRAIWMSYKDEDKKYQIWHRDWDKLNKS